MPTLFKRSNGIYYFIFNDSEGRRRWASTRKKVKSKVFEKIFKFKKGQDKITSRISLTQFISEFVSFAESVYSPRPHKRWKRKICPWLSPPLRAADKRKHCDFFFNNNGATAFFVGAGGAKCAAYQLAERVGIEPTRRTGVCLTIISRLLYQLSYLFAFVLKA